GRAVETATVVQTALERTSVGESRRRTARRSPESAGGGRSVRRAAAVQHGPERRARLHQSGAWEQAVPPERLFRQGRERQRRWTASHAADDTSARERSWESQDETAVRTGS